MSESVNSVYDWQQIEIFARQILGKKAFRDICIFWQDKPDQQPNQGTKQPMRLYIINNGACPGTSPSSGSAVKCVKLCKRAVLPDYPKNTITGTKKSRINHRYCLILLVEYENGEFKVITLPRQLSALGSHYSDSVMAFCEMINPDDKTPIPQRRNTADFCEKLTLATEGNNFSAFDYMMTFPINTFEPGISSVDLENPTLQSTILLSNLRYESDVAEPFLAPAGEANFIWTTAVDFMLYEDITIKLGVDQDIVVQGLSEL